MMRGVMLSAAAAALVLPGLLAPVPVQAAGPVDVELSALYWNSEFEIEGAGLRENDAGGLGLRGELWFGERFGFVAAHLTTDTADLAPGGDDVAYTFLDFRYRLVSPTENNFLAVGLGWQVAELGVTPAFGDTSGPRLSAQYRFGAEIAYGYAEVAWMPVLDDIDAAGGNPDPEDVEGWEYELGASIRLFPFTRLKVAYRQIELDMSVPGGGGLTSRSDGFMAGLGVRF